MCDGALKSFPAGEMVSQIHTISWLSHWLQTWAQDKQCPHEVIMDESAALIGASVAVFTQDKTTFQYIDRCVNVLLKKNVELPKCYIRIDRSHFVHSIHRNLRKGHAKTTRLLRGILGYLVSCSDFREFEQIMKDVFTLIRNEFISPSVIKAKDRLLQIVLTHYTIVEAMFSEITETEPNPENASDHFEDFSSDLKSHKDTSSYRWVMSVFNSVQIAEQDMPENIYHSSRFEKYLIHTFVRSPLWSNLMLHEFESNYDYAKSTPVESEFKTIKSLLNFKKYRVDAFLKKRLEHLSGQMKIAKADQNQKRNLDNASVRKRSDSLDMTELKKNQPRRSASFKRFPWILLVLLIRPQTIHWKFTKTGEIK